ncbi:cyclin-dependent kinase 4-like [Bolinopsis microptera]|uniref:cyclin-dependent kinase 4-like n=1 Tax=Bolinopsis microptera TaxID=2820187 RepID=UPI0030797AC8
MDNYKLLEKIGCGTFGVVYRALHEPTQEIVAVKQARIQQTYHGIPREFLREISVLRQTDKFKHPNIIRLIDLFMYDDEDHRRLMQLTLVFEYIEQDLFQFLQHYPQPNLPTNEIKNIVLQLVCGIEFLHSLSIIHRDLKPQNVLISTAGVIKIADFGLSKFIWIQKVVTPEVITLWYRAPEVLLNCDYSNKVDVWSLGCIFAELVNRSPLFNGRTEIEQLQHIFKVVGVPSEDRFPKGCIIPLDQFPNYTPQKMSDIIPSVSELGIDLFTNMMRFDLRDRITAANAMEHAWFDDVITCRRPGIMTRQRHSMSLAGPIPSLATDDDEIEIGAEGKGEKRKRSDDQSPESSSSKKYKLGSQTPKKEPPKLGSQTPKKEPPKTPKKDAPKTPKKYTPRKELPKTPKKFTPKLLKKETPRKETPRKDTPRKEVRIMCPEVVLGTPEKRQVTITSPRKSERLEKRPSPHTSGDESCKLENLSTLECQSRKSERLEKKASPVKSEETSGSALDKENVPCSSQTLR